MFNLKADLKTNLTIYAPTIFIAGFLILASLNAIFFSWAIHFPAGLKLLLFSCINILLIVFAGAFLG